MTEAAPAEQAVVAEKKKRLFHRIPTSLLVTIIGVALTAWLVPAFTRQWDDRQRAQDVRAGVAAQIAAGTADMIVATRKESRVRTEQSSRITNQDYGPEFLLSIAEQRSAEQDLLDSWLGYSIKTETLARAYFSPKVSRALKHYDVSMGLLSGLAAGETAITAQQLHAQFGMDMGEASAIVRFEHIGLPGAALSYMQGPILDEEHSLVAKIFDAHVAGYSTTSHDLIRDLIP